MLYYRNSFIDKLYTLVSGIYGLSGCIWILGSYTHLCLHMYVFFEIQIYHSNNCFKCKYNFFVSCHFASSVVTAWRNFIFFLSVLD